VNIALAAGGTAGHIEPALATAKAIKSLDLNVRVFLIGTSKGLETTLVPKAGFELATINAKAFPRKISLSALMFPFTLLNAKKQAVKILAKNQVNLVIGFGAYVSFPVYLAARKLKIPVIIHEGNAKAGIANKFFAKKANLVFQCFDNSLPQAITIGMPLRDSIVNFDSVVAKNSGLNKFNLDSNKKTILVFGGSQGAVKINQALYEVIGLLTVAGFQVLHAVGPNKPIEKSFDIDPNYHPVSYIDQMELAYAVADLVISRSGAMTVAEVTALGKVAIFVPFASGNGEQAINIKEIVKNGGAYMINDNELTGEKLFTQVKEIFSSEKRLKHVAAVSKSYGRRDAAQILAKSALTLAQSKK
jgi:UDP-N-acetylglucosamine--N-acetylmuramyl-(pentapeptide) pyrophosphoryl-undecaprenol N-acetylglucosamine transferase